MKIPMGQSEAVNGRTDNSTIKSILLTVELSVLLPFTASDCPFGIFILLIVELSVLPFTASDCSMVKRMKTPRGNQKP
jgi:hypothetical protein